MNILRSHIVTTARSFLGTPWKHQGRTRRSVDCVGLVYAVADDLGILPVGVQVPTYRRVPDGSVQGYFDRYMDRRPKSNLKPGMVLLHSFMSSPFHASILVDPKTMAIVHAFARHKAVVLDTCHGTNYGMSLYAAYDYRGVQDG